MRKLIIPILLFILLALCVSADLVTFEQFNDQSLDYSKWSYYNHGSSNMNFNWTDGNLVYDGTTLYGLWANGNVTGSATNSTTLRTISYLNSTTSGYVQTDAKVIFGTTLPATTAFVFGLGNYTANGVNNWISSGGSFCGVYIEWTNYNGFAVIERIKGSTGTTLYTIHANGAYTDDTHTIKINATRTINTTTFRVYLDNTLIASQIQNMTCPLYGVYSVYSNDNTYKDMYWDNFYMYNNLTTITAGSYPIGTFVGLGNDDDCLSGYAEYSKCALKPTGRDCTLDTECLSGECIGGKCNSAGAWDSMDQFVKGNFGGDDNSLMFISIFIIVALTIGIIFASRGSLAGVIAGGGVLFLTTIFFLIVGWLPAFFIVGLVILVILIIALMIILRG